METILFIDLALKVRQRADAAELKSNWFSADVRDAAAIGRDRLTRATARLGPARARARTIGEEIYDLCLMYHSMYWISELLREYRYVYTKLR